MPLTGMSPCYPTLQIVGPSTWSRCALWSSGPGSLAAGRGLSGLLPLCWAVTILLTSASLHADLPDAEPSRAFLRRPALTDYVNYGEDLYRPYRRQIRLQQRYDYLGNYLTEGFLHQGFYSAVWDGRDAAGLEVA
jgi:hypothetical protein